MYLNFVAELLNCLFIYITDFDFNVVVVVCWRSKHYSLLLYNTGLQVEGFELVFSTFLVLFNNHVIYKFYYCISGE